MARRLLFPFCVLLVALVFWRFGPRDRRPAEGTNAPQDALEVAPSRRGAGAGDARLSATPGAGEAEREFAVRVDATGHDPVPNAVRFIDADGEQVAFESATSGGRRDETLPLEAGRSEIVRIGAEARSALLLKDGSVIGRRELRLTPGQVNEIGP